MEFKLNGNLIKLPNPGELGSFPLLGRHLNLTGTEESPRSIVSISRLHPVTKEFQQLSVNPSSFPLLACADCEVETVEGLRNVNGKVHPVIQRLAEYAGSQCGLCGPGVAMSMHTLFAKKGATAVSMADVEKELSENVCDCAGYRSILNGMKTLTIADNVVKSDDLAEDSMVQEVIKCYSESRPKKGERRSINLLDRGNGLQWHRPLNLTQVFEILSEVEDNNYFLLGGNTAQEMYPCSDNDNRKVTIEMNYVKELKDHRLFDDGLWIGGAFTIVELINLMESLKCEEGFGYFSEAITYLEGVGTPSLRNTATVAGNLILKHDHPEFYSDIFIFLSAIGGRINVAKEDEDNIELMPEDFIAEDMQKKIIIGVSIPKLSDDRHFLRTYKIMNRFQNGNLFISAAFLFEFNSNGSEVNFEELKSIAIAYGGVNPLLTRLRKIESCLVGKNIFDIEVFQKAVQQLMKYLKPTADPCSPPGFRKQLAINLFYKSVLSIRKDFPIASKQSGGTIIERPLSSGICKWKSIEKYSPIFQPIPKIEAIDQFCGAIKSTHDIPYHEADLWCCFVLAKKINHRFVSVDASKAQESEDVVAFFDFSDIPGRNSFVSRTQPLISEDERIFLHPRARIQYHNQPVGMIVAKSFGLAKSAADLVEIKYEKIPGSSADPLDMRKIIETDDKDRLVVLKPAKDEIEPQRGTMILAGTYALGSQFHHLSKSFTTICTPMGMEEMFVQSASQSPEHVQTVLGEVLSIPTSRFHLTNLTVGGPFNLTLSRNLVFTSACALACHLLRRRVRFEIPVDDAMKIIGKETLSFYRIQVDEKGVIHQLYNDYYTNCGSSTNETSAKQSDIFFKNCYHGDNYQLKCTAVRTDTPSTTLPSFDFVPIAMVENIMEHVAYITKFDPVVVRMRNMEDTSPVLVIFKQLLETGKYYERKKEIESFNGKNRWKKKGIAAMSLSIPISSSGQQEAIVTINPSDGSVLIRHSAIEMGQGINTKVAQMAAHILNVPMKLITVTNEGTAPCTTGPVTDLQVTYAVRKACKILKSRIEPFMESSPGAKWPIIARTCHQNSVDLTERYFLAKDQLPVQIMQAACITEIELDVLTGQVVVQRVDILQDVGQSLNPLFDISRIEAGFTKGMGYWLTDSLTTDMKTGELLMSNSFKLKPPGPKDIPVDFRVELFASEEVDPSGEPISKPIVESSICLSWTIQPAIRLAIRSARMDAGLEDSFLALPTPCSPENILHLMGTEDGQMNWD